LCSDVIFAGVFPSPETGGDTRAISYWPKSAGLSHQQCKGAPWSKVQTGPEL